MTHVIVFEDAGYRDLYPLTLTRATFELRCGCGSLLDLVRAVTGVSQVGWLTRPAIAEVVAERHAAPPPRTGASRVLLLNGRLLLRQRVELPCPAACWDGESLIAAHLPVAALQDLSAATFLSPDACRTALASAPTAAWPVEAGVLIRYAWDLIGLNARELERQILAMPHVRAGDVSPGAHLIHEREIRIGAATRIRPTAVLDAENGPIHIGRDVTIMPHVTVRGPCSIGDRVVVQAGASIREGTSVGPVCKVGGEVEGTIFQGFANKQHDGFVGHSYVGEWVNLGADTVTSDLKNTYGPVSVPLHGPELDTGQRFVGSIIGDHTKTGICTALNTGTVIGFCCNVVHPRPPRRIPSLTWLTPEGSSRYDVERAIKVARIVMGRRGVDMTPATAALFRTIAKEAEDIAT